MLRKIEWVATFCSILGSFLMSFGFIKPAFIFFTFGSMLYLGVAMRQRNFALLTLNFSFFIANFIGIVRNFVL